MVATKVGIVMNGPIPTIIDMFRLTAWSRRSLRWSIGEVPGFVPRAESENATSYPGGLGRERKSLASQSEDVPAQVLILRESLQPLADELVVDDDSLLATVRRVEADVLEDAFQDGVQPAGADVLGRAVDLEGQVGHGLDGVAGELERDAFGPQQRLVLADQRGPRLAEDSREVVAGQVVHLDADGEPSLKLGHQVRRLGPMERPGGHEQDVIGLDRPVLGVDGRPLDDRQEVALDALPRDVRAARRAVVAGDLV